MQKIMLEASNLVYEEKLSSFQSNHLGYKCLNKIIINPKRVQSLMFMVTKRMFPFEGCVRTRDGD